jgi:hypothetical protein
MLEKDIDEKYKKTIKIKKLILEIGEMRTGSLSQQWNVCGNPNCRCKDSKNPKKHGPYYQLSYMRYKKSNTEFVSKENVESVKNHIKNYKRFMELKDEWIDLSIEISKLKKKQSK